tara:strand:+ start:627 stop:842 length:216 start_codon:yes stop_codon:yes gene_type:complete
MHYSFSELRDAVQSCTSYELKQSTDDEGEATFLLIDGCGDQDGDPFYDLIDVQDYVTNNQEVFNYLYQYNG